MLLHKDVHAYLESHRDGKLTAKDIARQFDGDVEKQRYALTQAKYHGVRIYQPYRSRHEDYGEQEINHVRELGKEMRR